MLQTEMLNIPASLVHMFQPAFTNGYRQDIHGTDFCVFSYVCVRVLEYKE